MSNKETLSKPKKIVIIGGGFAGLSAYNMLKKKIKHNEINAQIVLIDPKEKFEYTPSFHIAINKNSKIKEITLPFEEILGDSFIKNEVKHVHKDHVVLGNSEKIYFDYAIVATGARTNFFNNPNYQKYCYPVKTIEDIIKINRSLASAQKITVIGGGYSGVEIASVIAGDYRKKEVSLIHSQERILENLDEKSSLLASSYLARKGVKIYYNHRATDVTDHSVILNNGEELLSDMVIFTAGIKSNDEIASEITNIPITPKPDLSFENINNIFFPGDVSRSGRIPTAHNAIVEGYQAALNIVSLITNKPLSIPPSFGKQGLLFVALGRFKGVVCIGEKWSVSMPFTGFLKWLIEKTIIVQFKFGFTLPI